MTSRLLFAAAAVAAAPVLVLTAVAATVPHRTDLKCFWTGAQLFGRGLDPYGPAVWQSAVAGQFENILGRVGPSPCSVPYSYPLTTAVITLPLAWLPLEIAAVVWAGLGIAGLVAGVALLARAAGVGRAGAFALAFVLFASQPAWWNAIFLQYGGVLVAGLALLALPGAPRSRALTTIAALLLATKPHVIAPVLLERLRAAAPSVRIAALGVLAAITTIAFAIRPSWPLDWLGALAAVRPALEAVTPTTWALVGRLTGSEIAAIVICLAALALFVLALRGLDLRDRVDRLAVAVSGWSLVLPYMSMADLLVLVVAWCALIRRGALVLAVTVAVVIPWIGFRIDSEVGLGAVAPATAAALAFVLRSTARSKIEPAAA